MPALRDKELRWSVRLIVLMVSTCRTVSVEAAVDDLPVEGMLGRLSFDGNSFKRLWSGDTKGVPVLSTLCTDMGTGVSPWGCFMGVIPAASF